MHPHFCFNGLPMRKQYHFRQSADGLLAWDVHRLIDLAAPLPIEQLPVNEIAELDEPYWYDNEGDTPSGRSIAMHMQLVNAADLAYPIILCPQGRLMDGMHRAVKAVVLGIDSIQAHRLTVLPAPDFIGVDPDDLPYDD
ncbi:hypothetical protein [Stenotrophomonas humi]|uniref:hypothetical protein n=1 Tax=Stenotrophomonas humi TaxID=405444 RepID=UPI001B80961E|nr:hypothetical protein [Stenotrophomonas humi]